MSRWDLGFYISKLGKYKFVKKFKFKVLYSTLTDTNNIHLNDKIHLLYYYTHIDQVKELVYSLSLIIFVVKKMLSRDTLNNQGLSLWHKSDH